MKSEQIYLSLAHIGGRELDFIQEAFDTNWVVPLGPNVDDFERSLSDNIGDVRVPSLNCCFFYVAHLEK